jgi:uncharacterized protein
MDNLNSRNQTIMDYFQIIHRYIAPGSQTYPLYLIHCTLVAKLALEIGERLGLVMDSLRFIEEAAMLHDIGIVQTNMPVIFCSGPFSYLYHLTEGRRILEAEQLPHHAQVAQTHAGLSLAAERLSNAGIGGDLSTFMPQSIEEKIINFADLFYSKDTATLWRKRTVGEVHGNIKQFAPQNIALFAEWTEKFGVK